MTKSNLGEALDIISKADRSSLTSTAMAGKRAINLVTSRLPSGPQKTDLIRETGAEMQRQLLDLREAKMSIGGACLDASSQLQKALSDAQAGMDVDALVAAHREARTES